MFPTQAADPRETYISSHVAIFSMMSHFLRTNIQYDLTSCKAGIICTGLTLRKDKFTCQP